MSAPSAPTPSPVKALLRGVLTGLLLFAAASLLSERDVAQAPTQNATFYGDF